MKQKLTLLLLALFTTVGAWATVSFDSSKWYYIIEASTGRYAAFGVSGAEGSVGLQPAETKGDKFRFTEVRDGVFTITSASGNQMGSTHAWNTTEAATEWTIAESANVGGTYVLRAGYGYLNYQSAYSQSLYTSESNLTLAVNFYIQEATDAPSLPSNTFVKVSTTKADTFTPATDLSDNDHWYVMTQVRNGESPMYDNGCGTNRNILRAAAGTNVSGPTVNNVKYLVRFIPSDGSSYKVQFATGNYAYPSDPNGNKPLKTTGDAASASKFRVYNINNQDTHIGWNISSDGTAFDKRVDNNGAGNSVATWDSGEITTIGGNNDWAIYSVEFISTVEIGYTVTDQNGAIYNGTYEDNWAGDETAVPSIPGAYGATFSNKVFSESAGGYSFTADINFGFPVSSNSVNNPTAIQSALGNSLWYAKDGKVIADNAANTIVYTPYADNYRWHIIPVFSEGTFKFKLYNVGAAKYIPSNPSTSYNTATTLTDNEGNAGAFQYSHYSQGNGFYDVATSKFLTINSSGTGQNIWLWGGYGSGTHKGSVMSFPDLDVVSVSDAFATLKNAAKFDILDGSSVMGPGEFAAPASINAAIDAAQEVADTDESKMAFIESANGTMIQNYLNQVAIYGELANVQITMNKEYGTMILPCPCTRIDGLDIYSCSGAEGNVLTLTPVAGAYVQNTPYIIHATAGSKYTIIGWNKKVNDTYTSGWLTGALNATTEIPSGSYMLATNKSTDVQAFYQVSGSGVLCGQNKCYLTVPVGGVKSFFFEGDDEATAIEELFGSEVQDGTIYNLAGQRISKMQKGINIVNGKKVMVK